MAVITFPSSAVAAKQNSSSVQKKSDNQVVDFRAHLALQQGGKPQSTPVVKKALTSIANSSLMSREQKKNFTELLAMIDQHVLPPQHLSLVRDVVAMTTMVEAYNNEKQMTYARHSSETVMNFYNQTRSQKQMASHADVVAHVRDTIKQLATSFGVVQPSTPKQAIKLEV